MLLAGLPERGEGISYRLIVTVKPQCVGFDVDASIV
jgi:hypothetical protein